MIGENSFPSQPQPQPAAVAVIRICSVEVASVEAEIGSGLSPSFATAVSAEENEKSVVFSTRPPAHDVALLYSYFLYAPTS